MARHDRIAIVNVGWSELYEGDALDGDHAFLRKNGWGAERYNFAQDPAGKFHIYVRPVGPHEAVPSPRKKDGWLLVLVSKRKGRPGLYIVGWFNDASFLNDYTDRPEYSKRTHFPLTPDGGKFPYVAVSKDGLRVPEDLRDARIDTTAMRRTSIMYLRGHGKTSEAKELLAKSVLAQIKKLSATVAAVGSEDERDDADDRENPISSDTKRRQETERRSMEVATAYFERRGYTVDDVSRNKKEFCDLIAVKDRAPRKGERLCIEVKGTQAEQPRFLMSRRERKFMEDPINAATWRMLMVTSALNKPKLLELTVKETLKMFRLTTFTWFGEAKI